MVSCTVVTLFTTAGEPIHLRGEYFFPLPVDLNCWPDVLFPPVFPAVAPGMPAFQIQPLVQNHTCKAMPQAHGYSADQRQAPVLHPSAAWNQL